MEAVLPINRERVFVYGLRRDCYRNMVPRPLPPDNLKPILALQLLDLSLPNLRPIDLAYRGERDNLGA